MITWACHICKRERPNHAISVLKRDVSYKFGQKPGMCVAQVRYCNDNSECLKGARTHDFFGEEEVLR
jgi:hypothetical protein